MIEPRRVIGVGDEPVAGVIGEFGRLRLDMGALGAEGVHRRQVELRKDVQHQERRRAMAVRRMLDDLEILVVSRNRLGLVAACRREILEAVLATGSLERGDHVFGDFPAVESGCAVPGDTAQHFGLARCAEQLTCFRRLAVDQELVARPALQVLFVVSPVEGRAGCDRDPVFGVVDGRRKKSVEAEFPDCLR